MIFNAERAKKSELIQLPPDITGKSCATCSYFDEISCTNKNVLMDVDPTWGCKLWHHPGVKPASPKVHRSRNSEIISRLRKMQDDLRDMGDSDG
jgi:hypothetical protein